MCNHRLPFATLLIALVACGPTSTAPALPHGGYDFSYRYHAGKPGGKVTIALPYPPQTLNGSGGYPPDAEVSYALFDGCLVQLPAVTLGDAGYQPDQCREVPTVANGGESADALHTTFHVDPLAVWSDGQPITADDFLFTYRLNNDPNLGGGQFPYNLMAAVTKVDRLTVRIDWDAPFAPYLTALWQPLPLHAYNTGAFAGVYDPVTGAYDSAKAQALVADDSFNVAIPVDNGPFVIKNVEINQAIVMSRNPRFHSNYFTHGVALDQVTYLVVSDADVRIQGYRDGQYDHAEGFDPSHLTRLRAFAPQDIVLSPNLLFTRFDFNERPQALNAALNQGASIFADQAVRQAFIQSFDRCAALFIVMNIEDCHNPNFTTDDLTTLPDLRFDPSIKFPAYDPQAAAALLSRAGYPLVDGVRRARDGKTPLTVDIISPKSPIFLNYAALAQQQWEENLGILVTMRTSRTLNELFGDYQDGGTLDTGKYDIALYYQSFGTDPSAFGYNFRSDQIPRPAEIAGGNITGFQDPKVDTWLAQGLATLDLAKRHAIYQQLDAYLVAQCVEDPLYIQGEITLTRPTLGNYHQSQVNLGEWNIADWYTI